MLKFRPMRMDFIELFFDYTVRPKFVINLGLFLLSSKSKVDIIKKRSQWIRREKRGKLLKIISLRKNLLRAQNSDRKN